MSRFSELKVTGTGLVRFSNSPITRVKEAACGGAPQAMASRGRATKMPDRLASFDVATLDRSIAKRKEENARADSLFAIVVWVGCSIWWLSTTPEAHFVSWQTVVMIIPGMFAASIILGGGSYIVKSGIQALILRLPLPYTALLAALGGLLVPVAEIFIAYRLSGLALAFILGLGQSSTAANAGPNADAIHAIPLSSEMSAQLRDLYLSQLDAWVTGGGNVADVQNRVVETCGRLIMVTASASEAVAFLNERREDLDLRVDVCMKLTVTRAHPQPEFAKPEIRKIVCEDMPKKQAVFESLCKRAGLR